ncbi:transcriptional regulator with XRE-family HTH domain [Nesterenkonia lacusekhoensis]|uniref:Transcriptional regulator with XRE-family HTH domain n=1 Tax=Nesterenkonia lacusekhoensis TaxID=150832 RepID=A0ABS4SYS6_9MICC|nr:transcriptional regulator with XRE-family HTH domain [Nesterenkonia lacusekhoensis]
MDAAGVSSLRRLSEAAGIAHTGATRVVHGDNLPSAETVDALAGALNVPASTIYKLTHGQDISTRSWEPPADVHRLTKREQDLVTEMIRVLASAHDQSGEGEEHADGSAAMNRAAGSAAEDELEARRAERGVTRKHTPPWEREETAATEGPDDGTPHDDPGIEDP